ncbi:sensor histidine kinase [Streptomyces paradoxus]|uniref:sensor histidine kinase n=1 Tax=Streptomyces paradoxus TaxID=66375 RepID=UPI0037D01C02
MDELAPSPGRCLARDEQDDRDQEQGASRECSSRPGRQASVLHGDRESGHPAQRTLDQRRLADLTQPFRRLGADRTGTGQGSGLGLSIVAAITQAHHGTLDLRARPDGGLRVTITFPRTDGRATAQAPNTETGVAR